MIRREHVAALDSSGMGAGRTGRLEGMLSAGDTIWVIL
jgi:hypothetical protein